MIELLNYAQNGLGLAWLALTVNRVAMGIFFAISGYHKLFNADRHDSLVATLKGDGIPFLPFTQWLVPICEFTCGLFLVFKLFAPFAAVVLIIICTVAVCVDGKNRIKEEKPIDFADCIDDYLYLPELLYVLCLLIIVFAGPG